MSPRPEGALAMPLARALAEQEEALLTCVHCGFCLPACPTYTRLGDENDSPRGRLYLMRAVAEGRLAVESDALSEHIDRCLGCRACEPVCPSGVRYGELLEATRFEIAKVRRPPLLVRLLLGNFASSHGMKAFFVLSRLARGAGLPALALRVLPDRRPFRSLRLAAAMLDCTRRRMWNPHDGAASVTALGTAIGTQDASPPRSTGSSLPGAHRAEGGLRVGLLRGCVQQGLFAPVNEATERVLRVAGIDTDPVRGQRCCGALHAHGGALDTARELARANISAFEDAEVDAVVVNAAGCGAAMKEYGHLLSGDPDFAERARSFASRVRDVSELLGESELPAGAPVDLSVTYDAPCHLLHAQGVASAPLELLAAIPGLTIQPLARMEECCGGAGIYGVTHAELGGRIGGDKIEAIRSTGAEVVATGNPGCIMQIGAEARLAGLDLEVVHPVELLDASYRAAGLYDQEGRTSSSETES